MESLKVFYSYAHEDRDLCEELKKYLIPLKRAGAISDWYDRDISAGLEWGKEIDDHLGDADLILLLVSADFLASDYCWGVEVERAMERHDKGEARVVPVILRPCYWRGALFSKLQCLPTEAKPVTDWPNRDKALLDVTEGIDRATKQLRQIEEQKQAEERRKVEEQRRLEEEQRRLKEERRADKQRTEHATPMGLPRQPAVSGGDARERSGRGVPRWFVGVLVIVILGGGGYFISDQLGGEKSNVVPSTPIIRPKPASIAPQKEDGNSGVVDPPSTQESGVIRKPPTVDGLPTEKVKALQKQAAQEVGKNVEFRDRLKDGGQGPEMVVIPAGEFMMGSPEWEKERGGDERQHGVVIKRPFAMAKYEVAVAEFRAFVEATAYKTEAEQQDGCYGWTGNRWEFDAKFNWRNLGFEQADDHPVACVSWNDAMDYMKWLSEQTGEEYRLPTEAEWEYAARAGTTTPFWFGETISTEQANYNGDYVYGDGRKGTYRKKTVPVDAFEPNPWGLYNVHGNVWEWTCSEYESSYNGAEERCISNNDANDPRVLRGGSWFDEPRWLRSAERYWLNPGRRYYFRGFRLARSFSL